MPPPDNPRFDRFREEIAELDVKTPADSHERVSLVVGIGVMITGLVMIVGAYWGASGTPLVAEQIPYLLSGGLLGLALVVIGAALFVRSALSRYLRRGLLQQISEQRVQTDQLIRALAAIEDRLGTKDRSARGPEDVINTGPGPQN